MYYNTVLHTKIGFAYLLNPVIKNSTTEIIEICGVIWEEQLDTGNCIHRNMEVAVIRCGDKDELPYGITLGEFFQWKSQPGQLHWVFVQRQTGN